MEVVYTQKFSKFAPQRVGQTDELSEAVANNLIRKGYAIKKGEYESKPQVVAEIKEKEVIPAETKRRGNPNFGKRK